MILVVIMIREVIIGGPESLETAAKETNKHKLQEGTSRRNTEVQKVHK